MELRILQGPEVVHVEPIGRAAIHVGRASSNDLVLRDPDVSGHHAMLYREGDAVLVRDLGSTNGTFVNGVRIVDAAPLAVGDRLRFGLSLEACVARGEAATLPALRVERVDLPLGWPVVRTPFALPGVADVELLVIGDEVWWARDGEEQARLALDEVFSVDGQSFRVVADTGIADTVRPVSHARPVALTVDLAAGWAEVEALDGARSTRVETENRVSLLYALGRHWLRTHGEGWLDDDDAALGVWGRAHHDQGRNNLNVLVHRIRRQLDDAGLDRWVLERRTGQLRLSARRVVLIEGPPGQLDQTT